MIIIFWEGFGALALAMPVLTIVFTNVLVSAAFGARYETTHVWPKVVALFAAGIMCWFLGRYLNTRPGRVLVDKATGEEITLRAKHRFFFVPLEYWGAGWIGLGIAYGAAMSS